MAPPCSAACATKMLMCLPTTGAISVNDHPTIAGKGFTGMTVMANRYRRLFKCRETLLGCCHAGIVEKYATSPSARNWRDLMNTVVRKIFAVMEDVGDVLWALATEEADVIIMFA